MKKQLRGLLCLSRLFHEVCPRAMSGTWMVTPTLTFQSEVYLKILERNS